MSRLRALVLGVLVFLTASFAGTVWLLNSDKLAGMARYAAAFAFESDVRWEEISSDGWDTVVVKELQLMRPGEPDTIYGTIDEVRVSIRPWRIPFRDASIVKDVELRNARGTVRWDPKTGLLDMPSPIKEEYGDAKGGSLGDIPVVRLEGLFLTLEHAPYVLKARQELAFPSLKIDVMPDGSDRWLYRFGAALKDNPILGTFDIGGKFNAQTIQLSIHRPGDLVGEQLREILREPEDKRTAELLAGLSVKGDIGVGVDVFGGTGDATTSVGGTIRLDGASISHRTIPVRLDDIQGRVSLIDGVLSTRSLTARFENADLNVSADVDLRPQAERLVAADVDLVGLDLGGGFADRLSHLGGATLKVKEQVDAWQPRGFANLKGRLAIPGPAARVPANPEPWLFIDLDLRKSVAINYRGAVKEDGLRHGFPYLLSDVTGVVRFTDLDMRFDRVTASHGPAFIEARGVIGYERADDETYDVDIVAQGIPIDDALNDALEEEGRDLLSALDAEGVVDLLIGVKRTRRDPPGAPIIADVDLRGVRLRPKQFPLLADDARGRVHIEGSTIRIDGVRARHRGGDMMVSGRIGTGSDSGMVDLKAEFHRLPVEAPLLDALDVPSPEAADELRDLAVFGRVGGTVTLKADRSQSLDVKGIFDLEGVGLTLDTPKLPIENVEGPIAFENGLITVRDGVRATFAGERFAARGTIDPAKGLDLTVEADRFKLDEKFLSALTPAIPGYMLMDDRPILDGIASAVVRVKGPREAVVVEADVTAHGVDVAFANGLRLAGVEGRVDFAADGAATGVDLSAELPVARAGADSRATDAMAPERRTALTASKATWTPARAASGRRPASEARLSIEGAMLRDAPLGADFFKALALPANVESALCDLELSGRLDATCRRVSWSREAGWEIGASDATFTDMALGADRRVEARLLKVTRGSFVDEAEGRVYRGRIDGASVRAFGVAMPRLAADLACTSRAMELRRVSATLFEEATKADRDGETDRPAGGRLENESTKLKVHFTDGTFALDVVATDVSIPDLVRVFEADPGDVWGRIRCEVAVVGPMTDRPRWIGRARAAANVHNVVELPLFAKLFGIFDITKLFQGRNPGAMVDADAEIRDGGFHLSRVRVAAPDVSLDGKGWLGFDGRIRANFDATYRAGIDPLSLLGLMLKGLAASKIGVVGTLGTPDVSLSEIDATPPGPESVPASRPTSTTAPLPSDIR